MSKLAATLLAALLFASTVQAQDNVTEARSAFNAAERAFEEHDYELALEGFRRAQTLRPHDAVRFNVAVCLERLGRFREAAAEYELAAASSQLPETARSEARTLAERARSRLGRLDVRGVPAGASVRVDDQTCELPCALALDPGEHRVEIRGARTIEETATIARGQTSTLEVDATGGPEPFDATTPTEPMAQRGFGGFGVLSAIGGVIAAAGLAGILGFGITTEDLAVQYRAMPTEALYGEGTTMRDLTNASIGVAALGGVLIVIDLAILLASQ